MRFAIVFMIIVGVISCKNLNDSSDSGASEVITEMENSSPESQEDSKPEAEIKNTYTPEVDTKDGDVYVISGTKILEGALNSTKRTQTFRVKGSISKEMVIQLMTQDQNIYFNLRVEGGETLAEKKRQFMFTVSSNEVLVIDVTSDKALTEKVVVNAVISQI